jgi:hypothetical protein
MTCSFCHPDRPCRWHGGTVKAQAKKVQEYNIKNNRKARAKKKLMESKPR